MKDRSISLSILFLATCAAALVFFFLLMSAWTQRGRLEATIKQLHEEAQTEDREEGEGKCEIAEARAERDEFQEALIICRKEQFRSYESLKEARADRDNLANDLAEAQRERTAVNAGFVACEHKQRELRDRLEESERRVIELKEREKLLNKYIDECQRYERNLRDAYKSVRDVLARCEARPRCECGECEPRHHHSKRHAR